MDYAYFRHLLRDIIIIAGSIVIAVVFAESEAIHEVVKSSESIIVPSIIAGGFFTSVFTVAPATISLIALSEKASAFQVAALGAVGGMIVDYLIASFVRKDISQDLSGIANLTFRQHFIKAFHFGFLKWIAFGLGLFLIVTPLPDEFGLTLIGLSKVRSWMLPMLFYVAHFVGIYALVSIIQSI